jgi:hypothetical protein
MATHFLHLEVPADFVTPSLLNNPTPETCVNVIIAGVAAVECANKNIAESTNETLVEQLNAKHEADMTRVKKDAATEYTRIQKDCERLKADLLMTQSLRNDSETRLSQAVADARRRAEEDAEERIRKSQAMVKEALEARQSAEEKMNNYRDQVLEEQKRSTKAILAVKEEERNRAEDKLTLERERLDKIVDEKTLEIQRLKGLSTSSSLKGGAFEYSIKNYITDAFGNANKFNFLPKQTESGDHIFEWEDFRIMVEDKDKKEITNEDIKKATRDLTIHSECDLLLFISANTHIPNHKRPGDIDFDTIDKRPVIFLSNFNDKDNKVGFLQSLQPIMRILIDLTKNSTDSPDTMKSKLETKIRTITNHFKHNQNIIRNMVNNAKAAERNITTSLNSMMLEIENVQSAFNNSLKAMLKEDDIMASPPEEETVDEPPSSTEVSVTTTITQAPIKKSVPKKKSTPNA